MSRDQQSDPLERSYRRLLYAYPRRYRRTRGEEMVTTLLDAAAPGQRRPTRHEVVDLLTRGLRARLAVPHGPAYTAVAAMTAVIVALVASTILAWWTWNAADTMPSASRGLVVVGSIVDREPSYPATAYESTLPWGVERPPSDDHASIPDGDPAPGFIGVEFAMSAQDARTTVESARRRLVADGWRAGAISRTPQETAFWAVRGDEFVRVGGLTPDDVQPMVWVHVHRAQPALVTPAAVAGLATGLFAGWLLAGWALRRFQVHRPGGQLAMVLCGVPGLLLAALPTLRTVADVTQAVPRWSATDTLTFAHAVVANQPLLTVISVLGLLAALATAAVSPRGERTPAVRFQRTQLWRYGTRFVALTHLAFAIAWCAVAVIYLATMLSADGGRAEMLSGAHDPKDLLPFGIYVVLALLFTMSFLASPVLLLVSVPLLVAARRRVGRLTWSVLLVAAGSAVALPVLAVTPFGSDVSTWWLD